jgi:hypothetical protein
VPGKISVPSGLVKRRRISYRRGANHAGERPDRLGKQLEATRFEHIANVCGRVELAMPKRELGVLRPVDMHPVAPPVLGHVTGHVGLTEQRRRALGQLGHRDQADTDTNAEAACLPREAELADAAEDGFHNALRIFDLAVLEQQAELVAAEPAERVPVANVMTQQVGELSQQLVAGDVTAGIVDHLELIEVQVSQHVSPAALARALQGICQAPFELPAVDEFGQRIVLGLVLDLSGETPGFGDVLKDQHGTEDLVGSATDRCRRVGDQILLAAAADQHRVVRQAGDDPLPNRSFDRVRGWCSRMLVEDPEDLGQPSAARVFERPAGELFRDRVEVVHTRARIGSDRRITDRAKGDLSQLSLLEDRLFGLLPLGDVLDGQ